MPGYKTLIIEDFADFRRFIRSTLQQRPEFQVVHEASTGLEGVQRAEELQPDLILVDIGLPGINGIEAARRICKVSPNSKILFLSQESSDEIVQEAFSVGADGYVLKSSADSELLFAIEDVLSEKRFVSRDLMFDATVDARHRHEVFFCSDDAKLLNGLASVVGTALQAGNAAIVWATASHREALCRKLHEQNVDIVSAIEHGTCVLSDVSEPPDARRILTAIKGLREAALHMGKRHPRVVLCGERAGRLWAEGKIDTALHIESLCNDLVKSLDVDIFCVYPVPENQHDVAVKHLCAEHTAVRYL